MTASVGTVTRDGTNWSWSFATQDGPPQTQTVTIIATDNRDASGSVTFQLNVLNVAPSVGFAAAQVTTIDEGTTLTVQATFTDPGVLDAPFTAQVQCYDLPGYSLSVPGTVNVTTSSSPVIQGTVTAQCPYGDTSQQGTPPAGTFQVGVSVTDKDGGTGSASFQLTVRNVAPTPEIDTSGATDVNGGLTDELLNARCGGYAVLYGGRNRYGTVIGREKIVLDSPGTRSHGCTSAENGVWLSYPSRAPELTGFRALLAELRRRRVVRVAAVYAAVGFVLVQVANNFFPALHLPAWATTLVAVLVMLGFPIALVLAWALDLTPDGIRRAEPGPARPRVDAGPTGRWTAQRIAAVGGALVLAMAGGAFLVNGGQSDGTIALDREVERSVAVLPFANLSAEADNEYFSDGITEDIRGRLSRIGELRVISRTSAMTFKGTTQRAGAIGEELGVAHLIEGSVQRSGDRLRVSAQLVDARTDETRWSETYDRHVTDVFAIQSEIAERIAEALRVRLTAGDRALLGRAQTTNLAAYELFLRADELLRRRSPGMAERRADVLRAVALLRQAVQLDPDYALPYAYLSWGYSEHPDLTARERMDSVRTFGERVVRMAPELPDGYAELGYFYLGMGELERAGEQFRLALARDPNHEVVLTGMRDYLGASGRLAEALSYAKQAVEVVPTDPWKYAQVGRTYAMLGDFDLAETWYRRAWFEVTRDPGAGYCDLADIGRHRGDVQGARGHLDALLASAEPGEFALGCAAYLELALGNVTAARDVISRGARSSFFESEDGMPRLLLAVLALDEGDGSRAETLLRDAEARTREEWELCEGRCGNYQLARIRALQGDPDEAISYVRRAVDTGLNRWYPSAPDPFLSSIHGDPRYQAILTDVRARLDRERERLARAVH